MALLESCLCLNLLTATIVSGLVTMILYLLAFALELWWIIECHGRINATAYILCAGYFILFFLSVIMIAGIIGQKTTCVLIWIFFVVIFFLPEAGLSIYTSIFEWKLSSSNGVVELILWIIRTVVNIFAVLIVQSQCSMWRDEKQVKKQLHSLQMESDIPHSITTNKYKTKTATFTNDTQPLQGYENLGFSNITEMLPSIVINNDELSNVDGRLQRSISSASQLQLTQKNPLYGGSLPATQLEPDQWLPSSNLTTFDHCYSHMNESDAINYNPMVFPIDSNIELGPKSAVQLHIYRPRSLMYLDENDYLTRPPPSRAVSMNYVNVHAPYSTQSLDRARCASKGERKTTSLDFLDMSKVPGMRLQKLPMKPFDYLNRPGSKQSDIDNISDDVRKIRDVAL